MKKIIATLVFTLMIIAILPCGESLSKVNINKSNNLEKENSINELDKTSSYLSDYVVMQDPPKLSDINFISEKPIPKSTPDEFSWKNYNGKDWTTPAKHQGNCGSCWDFAALGVYESMIKIREDCADFNPDLSEQYLLSCINGAGSCHGGNAHRAFELLQATTPEGNYENGIIPESCQEYMADDSIPCSDKCDNWEDLLVPILDFGTWQVSGTKDDIESIKTQIMDNGPVVAYLKATDMFRIWGALNHNPLSYYNNILPVAGSNHVVMIIGWKDIPSILSGGYWICKNSWGEQWGYDGYFNLVYGDLNIDNFMITWADYDPDSFDWPPIAITDGPYGVYTNQELNLDASDSFGVEGDVIDYHWDFGDEQNSTDVTTSHTYTETGKYTVDLIIEDSENNIGNTETNVWVQNTNEPPNKPTITGPTVGHVGNCIFYKFSSTDPEGNDVWYLVQWSDEEIFDTYGPYESGEETEVFHYWENTGSFTIKAKAIDVFGDESDWETFNVLIPKSKINDNSLLINFLDRLITKYPIFSKILQILPRMKDLQIY